MSRRFLILFGMTIGSVVGGYVPVLFGVELFSFTSIICNAIGGILGIWISYKLTEGF